MSAIDVPPWPRMPPTRGEAICSGVIPESATACRRGGRACAERLCDPLRERRVSPTEGAYQGWGKGGACTCCIAMNAYLALMPMNRPCLRSMKSSQLMSGVPQMWDFIPISLYFSLNLMPGLAACRESDTSSRVLPRQDTMPIPVTTIRRSPCHAPGTCGQHRL